MADRSGPGEIQEHRAYLSLPLCPAAMETGDICKALGISPTHCWVILYRARMSLRACLETAWFGAEEKIGAAK